MLIFQNCKQLRYLYILRKTNNFESKTATKMHVAFTDAEILLKNIKRKYYALEQNDT